MTEAHLRRFIDRQLELRPLPGGIHQVRVKNQGLLFYWLGQVSGGLANAVRQEFDSEHPHCYTTCPVQLTSSSRVLDVGACEGLFAFRVLKQGTASQVTCFEPSTRTASFLMKAAEANGCVGHIALEIAAVGAKAGEVNFSDSDLPEANRVLEPDAAGGVKIPQVTLDGYCNEHKIALTSSDLIKVDAEGADLDVLRGAQRLIREGAPQIAVTTYHNLKHAEAMIRLLRSLQPMYRFRLKGFTLWNSRSLPRPVLLQASVK